MCNNETSKGTQKNTWEIKRKLEQVKLKKITTKTPKKSYTSLKCSRLYLFVFNLNVKLNI